MTLSQLTWTTGTRLPGAIAHSQAVVTRNRVYLLGGSSSSSLSSTVYTAPILPDGTLGGWTIGTPLPGAVYGSQAVVTRNRVYLLGGSGGSGLSTTVYTAPILSDGTLGSWTTGASLPVSVCYSQTVVTRNRVYLLGGYVNGGISSTVYTAPVLPDGTLGSWTTGSPLPDAVYYSQTVVTRSRVYLLGGYINSSESSTVYTAPILSDGTLGSWTTGAPLPDAVTYSQTAVTRNRVYLLGGYDGSGPLSTVYTAPILPDGTLGSWTTGASLPGVVYNSQAVVTRNRVYLFGGYVDGKLSSNVYVATLD